MGNNVEFRLLVSGAEKIQLEINKAAGSLEEFSKAAKSLGRDLSQVGQTVSLLGASISGPLVLAFNNSAKSSAGAAEQIRRFQVITQKFQDDIANALVPVFEKLNNVLSRVYDAFNSLDQQTKNQFFQVALLTGVFLTFGGVLTVIVAKVISLASNLASLASKLLVFAAVHPVMLAVGVALVVIVALMFKFRTVADTVLNAFQALFILLQNGFITVRAALEEFTSISLRNIANILNALAKIPGPQQEALQGFADNISNLSALAHRFAYEDLQTVVDKANELGTIFVTGRGSWAMAFDDLKTKANEFFATLSDRSALDSSLLGWKSYIDKLKLWWQEGGAYYKKVQEDQVGSLKNTLQQAAQLNSKFATAYKVVAIGEAIMNTAAGVTRAFKDYAFPYSLVVAGLVGAAGAVQIATIAAQSFAVGTPEIPKDMMAQVHKGETIIPESFADAIRSGELSLSGGGGGGSPTFDFSGATFNGVTESFVRDIFTRASEAINNRTLSPLPAV